MSKVLEALVAQGWQGPSDDHLSHGSRYVWAAGGMFPERPICDCNGRAAGLTLTHHSFDAGGQHHESYELAMRFEKNGQWYDLKAYSLRSLEEIELAIPIIIRAGQAVAQGA